MTYVAEYIGDDPPAGGESLLQWHLTGYDGPGYEPVDARTPAAVELGADFEIVQSEPFTGQVVFDVPADELRGATVTARGHDPGISEGLTIGRFAL